MRPAGRNLVPGRIRPAITPARAASYVEKSTSRTHPGSSKALKLRLTVPIVASYSEILRPGTHPVSRQTRQSDGYRVISTSGTHLLSGIPDKGFL